MFFIEEEEEVGTWPSMKELQARYARWVLKRLGGDKKRAEEILGISRNTLNKYLKESIG